MTLQFSGDSRDSKSTSGCFLALVGPNSFYPLTAVSKKQTAVSHSTSEAEVVALDACVRTEGIPMLMLLDVVKMVLAPRGKDGGTINLDVHPIDRVPCNMPLIPHVSKLLL